MTITEAVTEFFKQLSHTPGGWIAWQHDPCFDLPDHLKWYQTNWEKYWKERTKYRHDVMSEKYFAWRLYFADQMLNQL